MTGRISRPAQLSSAVTGSSGSRLLTRMPTTIGNTSIMMLGLTRASITSKLPVFQLLA